MYNVVNDFDEGDDLTVLKNQGMGLRTEIPSFPFMLLASLVPRDRSGEP